MSKAEVATKHSDSGTSKGSKGSETLGPAALTQRGLWLGSAFQTLLSHLRQDVVGAGGKKRVRAKGGHRSAVWSLSFLTNSKCPSY